MRSILYILPLAASFFGSTQAGVLGDRGYNIEQRSGGSGTVYDPTSGDELFEPPSKSAGYHRLEWEFYEVDHDFKTDEIIFDIRENLHAGDDSELRLYPTDENWKKIAATPYYSDLMSGRRKEIREILLTCVENKEMWEWPIFVNRIGFGYRLFKEDKTPVPETSIEAPTTETQPEFDGEEQGDALRALFDEVEG
ncbi:hypothetical protein HOO65_070291 [Ceratocystis lukuohia]|uniref:Secreted protein n=1 Tax=Ceratocystis lukuohia TaxID=2019550 RepID=A0ABR4MC35_9PEZI